MYLQDDFWLLMEERKKIPNLLIFSRGNITHPKDLGKQGLKHRHLTTVAIKGISMLLTHSILCIKLMHQ